MSDLITALWNAKGAEVERIRQAIQEASFLSLPGNLSRDLETTGTPTISNEVDAENLVLDPFGRSGEWLSIWSVSGGTLAQVDIADLPRFPYAVQALAKGGEDLLLRAIFDPTAGGEHTWQVYVKSDWLSAESKVYIRQDFSPNNVVGSPVVLGEEAVPISIAGWTRLGGVVTLPIPKTTLSKEQTLPLASIEVASTAGFPPAGQLVISGQTVSYTGIEATKFTGCTGGEGTLPKETVVEGATPGRHRIELSLHLPEAGKSGWMCAPTAVVGAFGTYKPHAPGESDGQPDPEPFGGDLATTDQYAYDWAGARHHSRSRRFGRAFPLQNLREQEANFSVEPEGLTHAQRQTYLLARWQARRKPWASTFTHLIAVVIASDTGESVENIEDAIRVIEDFEHYSFKVELPYSETGVVADRIKRLIEGIKPAHLNVNVSTGITWGTFRTDISKTDEDAV